MFLFGKRSEKRQIRVEFFVFKIKPIKKIEKLSNKRKHQSRIIKEGAKTKMGKRPNTKKNFKNHTKNILQE